MPLSLEPGSKRLVDEVVVGVAEPIALEAHTLAQFAEEIGVRPALAERLDRLVRNLQVVMPVGRDRSFCSKNVVAGSRMSA